MRAGGTSVRLGVGACAAALALGGALFASPVLAQPRAQNAPPQGSVSPRGPVTLRLRYVPGQTVHYVNRTVQAAQGPAGRTTTTAQMDLETVRARPDGGADLRMRVGRVVIDGPALPASARAEITRGMTGMQMEYTQNDRGQITARQAPTGVSEAMRPVVDAVMQSLDQVAPQLPERPVSVGDTWTERRLLHTGAGPGASLDMNVETRYTLRELRQGPAGQTAVIGTAMTLTLPQGANVSRVPVTGGGTASGELALELWRAAVTRSRSRGELTMHLALEGRNVDLRMTFENDLTAQEPPRANPATQPSRTPGASGRR